jgi:hypothetical protein
MINANIELQDFFLSRELAEVYLLLDHIATIDGKSLPAKIEEPVGVTVFDQSKSWLQQICDITWPPEETTHEQDARNAARLIIAKDALTEAAKPANGTTIAFTLMIAGEARDSAREASWWRKWRSPRPVGDGGIGNDGGASEGGRVEGAGDRPGLPSRASLAALAYQGLSRRAWVYRWLLYTLLGFLAIWAIVTCLLSWDVATGTSLLNRVNSLDERLTIVQRDGAANPPSNRTGSNIPPAGEGNQASRPPVTPPAGEAGTPEDKPKSAPDDSLLEQTRILRESASVNLSIWLEHRGFLRDWLKRSMGAGEEDSFTLVPIKKSVPAATPQPAGQSPAQADDDTPAFTQVTNIQWAAAFLGVLAGSVLPICYGLLGAGAAVVRGVSAKMRDSELSPRDIVLAYVQLVLGAVMGLCIGLFVNPDSTTSSGLIGSIHLSASALCFVAGFGVEQVFRALESLIRRIFDADPTNGASKH